MTLLRIPTRVSAAADRPASYGNQTISSTRPSCLIQIATVDVINIAADHVYDTHRRTKLTAPETISRLLLLKKLKKSLFEPPFRGLRSNVRTPSMARWKARGQLYICRSWTFFAISYGWDVMSGNRTKSAFFVGGWSFWAQISEGRGHRPPTTVGVRKLEWLPFRAILKYPQYMI